jgi:hypothetical protein
VRLPPGKRKALFFDLSNIFYGAENPYRAEEMEPTYGPIVTTSVARRSFSLSERKRRLGMA